MSSRQKGRLVMINNDCQPEEIQDEWRGIPLARSVMVFRKELSGELVGYPSVWAALQVSILEKDQRYLPACFCFSQTVCVSAALAVVISASAILHWHRILASLAFELNRETVAMPSAADWSYQGIQLCGLCIRCVLSFSSMQTSNVGLLSLFCKPILWISLYNTVSTVPYKWTIVPC